MRIELTKMEKSKKPREYQVVIHPGLFNPEARIRGPYKSKWGAVFVAVWAILINPHAAAYIQWRYVHDAPSHS